MDKIKLIHPSVFGDDVRAFFTLKNKNYRSKSRINGLNLGYNTSDIDKVVTQNRRILLDYTGIKNIAYAKQVHGCSIKIVKKPTTVKNCDAIITQTAGLALAIRVADCAAVLIYEPKSKIIAAVHAGWRGAAGNIILKVLQLMKAQGANLSSAKAYISPSICMKHFEVGEEVAEQFSASFVDYERFAKPHVDLKGFIRYQLMVHKLKEENIELDECCTVEDRDRFYSYRREKEKSGRMLAVIQMK